VVYITIFSELEDLDKENPIPVNCLRDILKDYAKTISVFDEMRATGIIRDDCKYMQKDIREEYLEVYIKYFFKRIKEILNDNENYHESVDKDKFHEYLDLSKEQFKEYRDSSSNNKYPLILTLISFYTTFIKDEPIHPVGTPFPGKLKLLKVGDDYFCPVKDKQSNNPNALCNLCISKQQEL